MDGLLKTAVAYCGFGLLTLIAFLTINMLPASVSADEVVQSVAEFLFPDNRIDPKTLIRFEDKGYEVHADASVSTDVLATSTVRKIGYGNSEIVTITTTESGTYSSDAFESPNISYPGIEVARIEGRLEDFGLFASDSFLFMLPTDSGVMILGKEGACVVSSKAVFC